MLTTLPDFPELRMLRNALLLLFLVLPLSHLTAAEETRLLPYSGESIENPYWFKESFLDLAEDLEEARAADKSLLIYIHQAGCPYCYNLVQQSFLDPVLSEYLQQHFDLVALNLWGDREVTLPDGRQISEKALVAHWQVQYTPTLLFFRDSIAAPVLRVNGYRNREQLAQILDHVASKDDGAALAQALIQQDRSDELYPSVSFSQAADLSQPSDNSKPLAVLFEYPGCADCDQLHRQVLSQQQTFDQLTAYNAYRVDMSDQTVLTTPDGQQLTAVQWAAKLGLNFYPSVLLFDADLQERFRIDGYVQAFHFNTALEYVSQKIYLRQPQFQRYINERAERMRNEGARVIITR